MEEKLLTNFQQMLNQNPKHNNSIAPQALTLARSLIVNLSTSQHTLSSLLETLTLYLQNPKPSPLYLHYTLSLLSDLSLHHPHFSHIIFTAVRTFSLLPIIPTSSLADSLSLLLSVSERDQSLIPSITNLAESLFLSLCFRPRVSVRHWLLQNVDKFCIRPSLLLTVLLGFTKDPYPYIRSVALDGLNGLCKCIVVEDHTLVEGCYFRAVELLFDPEDCVRCSAVRVVSGWGQLIVAFSEDNHKKDWSDALFVQLCLMVRDMSMKVRYEAFDALGKVGMVSEEILLQTLRKKALEIIKEKKYPGQFTAKTLEIPASSASRAFIHGLEDEFYEVRRSACRSLRTLSTLSADFAGEALNFLMDMLNDESMAVRMQALETLHHMAIFHHLKVQETQIHMLLGTLVDGSTMIRSAARKILRLIKLQNFAVFNLSVDALLENSEMYPQDEADIFSVLFNIGRSHGNFAVHIIEEHSEEIGPSFDGKLGLDGKRSAALLVLAISAPLSLEQHICSIPPRIFSYAVTLLGRISRGLNGIMDQSTLLAYLSHCSRSKVVSAAEFFKGEEPVLPLVESDPIGVQLQQICDGPSEIHYQKTCGLRKIATPLVDYQPVMHDDVANCVMLILAKVKDVWSLIQFGCTGEGLRTLRSWKEELATFTTNSLQYAGGLIFVLKYLRVVELLGKAWVYSKSPRKLCSSGTEELGVVLGKLDQKLREMRYRFIQLSKEEELHILELILVTCTLRLSTVEACYHQAALKKLHSTVSHVEFLQQEGSIELSNFVIELKNSLREIGTSDVWDLYSPSLFQKSLECFSLTQFVFCGKFKYVHAELDVQGNDFENPLPFISGLPVGIPFEITLYNILSETRLWLKMTVDKELTQFVFLDLNQFGGCDEVMKFTFVAPFHRTPKVEYFTLRVCIGMECLSEGVNFFKYSRGPKHELAYLCKEKEVHLSLIVR